MDSMERNPFADAHRGVVSTVSHYRIKQVSWLHRTGDRVGHMQTGSTVDNESAPGVTITI